MDSDRDAGRQLHHLGWRQGSVLGADAINGLSLSDGNACTAAVIVSQSCDIVASTSTEETVEVALGEEVAQPDPASRYGRHPRTLVLPTAGTGTYLALDIRRRTTVRKQQLAGFSPDPERKLAPRDVRLMARWIAKRYTRPAFPDTFNTRLTAARSKLERITKASHGKRVTSIFVLMEEPEAELSEEQPYRIVLWFACRTSDHADPKVAADLERFASGFAAALGECTGIFVEDFEVRPHNCITLEDLEQLKRFDYDYRSTAPKPGGAAPPPMTG